MTAQCLKHKNHKTSVVNLRKIIEEIVVLVSIRAKRILLIVSATNYLSDLHIKSLKTKPGQTIIKADLILFNTASSLETDLL